jgi:16S rRNA (adenine1518-N6/adenine1519-N6)-dimethyltransferase
MGGRLSFRKVNLRRLESAASSFSAPRFSTPSKNHDCSSPNGSRGLYSVKAKGLRPKRALGQNFLVNEKVVAEMVAAADLTANDVVVEVGAGTGVLTKELAKKARRVIAFEIDRDLITVQRYVPFDYHSGYPEPVASRQCSKRPRVSRKVERVPLNYKNVEIVNEDFLKSEIRNLKLEMPEYKVIGSIPYQITSPLIHKLLTMEPKPTLVVLLIQKEVAEKLTARPPKATYLSNIVQLLGEVEIVRYVPKEAFWPVPEVDGAIIKLKMQSSKFKVDVEAFQKVLRRGFQNPRKMLRKKFAPELLNSVGINPTARAQELTLDDWKKLYISKRPLLLS